MKTQTRRVVKPMRGQQAKWLVPALLNAARMGQVMDGGPGLGWGWQMDHPKGGPLGWIDSPYGGPGDFLWVRETWRVAAWREERGVLALDYRASPEEVRTPWLSPGDEVFQNLWEQSTVDAERALAAGCGSVEQRRDGGYRWDRGDSPCRWRPSIHMPRWASRISLRVESVRVERLHDISIADAQAEGVEAVGENGPGPFRRWRNYQHEGEWYSSPRASFGSLWSTINGAESWAANPWVWVVTFARVDTLPEGAKARPIPFTAPMVRAILEGA